jgi:hypothetical protein
VAKVLSAEEFRRKLKAGQAPSATAPPPEPSAGGEGAPPETPADWIPFPIDCIPQPARQFVVEGALSLNCDAAYLAGPALTVLAAAVGNTTVLQAKKDFVQPAILWTGICGSSGTRKTSAYLLCMRHFSRLQLDMLKTHNQALREFESDLRTWQLQESQAGKNGGLMNDDYKPQPPKAQRLFSNNVTIEKLMDLLADNPRGIMVARPELAGWVGSFTRYNKSSDRETWLELYDGHGCIVDRKSGSGTIAVQTASSSITGGFQPEILQECLTSDHLESGLFARFLLCQPPDRLQRWVTDEISDDTNHNWERLLDSLLLLDFATDNDGRLYPHVLRFTAEAQAAYEHWFEHWAKIVYYASHAHLKAALSKGYGQAVRLALIHHAATAAWAEYRGRPLEQDSRVSLQSVAAATQIVEWFAGQARKIYSQAEHNALIEFIQKRGGSVSVRDLYVSKVARNADESRKMLMELVYTNKGLMKKDKKSEIFFLS